MPTVILLAKVIEVKNGPYWFPRCQLCFRKVHCQESSVSNSFRWTCKCGWSCADGDVCYTYRLPLTVTDGSVLEDVTVFGNQLSSLFGVSADKLLSRLSHSACNVGSVLRKVVVGRYFTFTFTLTSTGCNTLKDLTGFTGHGKKKSLIAKSMQHAADSDHYNTVIDCITSHADTSSIHQDDFADSAISLRAVDCCSNLSTCSSGLQHENVANCDIITGTQCCDSPVFDSVLIRTNNNATHLKLHENSSCRNAENGDNEALLSLELAECSLDLQTVAEQQDSTSCRFLSSLSSSLDDCNWTELENCDNVAQVNPGTFANPLQANSRSVSDDCGSISSISQSLPSQATLSPSVICSTPLQRHTGQGRRANAVRLCTRQMLPFGDSDKIKDNNISAVSLRTVDEGNCVTLNDDENIAANCSADLFD